MDNDEQATNKRKRARVPFSVKLALSVGGQVREYEKTLDISTGGIFVFTDKPLENGTKGDFVIRLLSRQASSVEIKGKFQVIYRYEKQGKKGMGLNFTRVDPESSLELYKIIRYNQPT